VATENRQPALWVVIPAAGVGRRMGADKPKQFLRLGSRSVLEYTLDVFLEHPAIRGVVLVLGAGVDPDVMELPDAGGRLSLVTGGAERADSVRNGLAFLAHRGQPDDWVLVHDAARPCLPPGDLDHLIEVLRDDPVGGLLVAASTDTLKLAGAGNRVERTLDRRRVWRALTPQMFRLQALRAALEAAADAGVSVTDEASAMEFAGQAPRLVEGSSMNIKITRPEDLDVAEVYLIRQQRLRSAR
jgi:2-C-methyl-D-erythritol 4-phosphate cytidylyltransferase